MNVNRIVKTWRGSRLLGAQLEQLDHCPCCLASGPDFLFHHNDLWQQLFVDRRLKRGHYSLCMHCGTVFAARRPKAKAAQLYYDLFPETQSNRHDIYPPPSRNSKGKISAARDILAELDGMGLLRDGMSVLHVRCDAGALLSELRKRLPAARLHGLDYFDNNLRYLREQGFAAERLDPAAINPPPEMSFDLILSNHLMTHSLDPRGDLRRLKDALNEGGNVLFYNEHDHLRFFEPASKMFRRVPVVGYHKQLFIRESFEACLSHAGFACRFLGYRRDVYMMYLAKPGAQNETPIQVPKAVIEHQRSLIRNWHKATMRYLYFKLPFVQLFSALQWLTNKVFSNAKLLSRTKTR